jgi:hypothetical protein
MSPLRRHRPVRVLPKSLFFGWTAKKKPDEATVTKPAQFGAPQWTVCCRAIDMPAVIRAVSRSSREPNFRLSSSPYAPSTYGFSWYRPTAPVDGARRRMCLLSFSLAFFHSQTLCLRVVQKGCILGRSVCGAAVFRTNPHVMCVCPGTIEYCTAH